MDFSAFERHERIVLQFSGGRDSLATLLVCEPWWHKLVVAFGNRGAEYPETHAIIDQVRAAGIRVAEIHPPIPHELAIERFGYPVDLIPVHNVDGVDEITGQRRLGPKVQSYLECCSRMLWQPMERFCQEYGATLIIRGQRLDEDMRSQVRNGDVINGVEYFLPIEQWTEADVDSFIEARGWKVPDHYQWTTKSLDCWSCTAYLHENRDSLAYTRAFHPDLWKRLAPRLQAIRAAVGAQLQHLDAACGLTED